MPRARARTHAARESRPGFIGGSETSVLIVDDFTFVRAGLRTMLKGQGGIQVLAEADSVGAAMRTWTGPPPDVALMLFEVIAGRHGGMQAITQMRAKWPDTHVLVLIPVENIDALFASIQAGASGYLPAGVSTNELARALRAVAAGQSPIDPAMAVPVIEHVRRSRRDIAEDKLARLSPDEQRVLALLVQGQTNLEIALQLGQSLATAKKRVSSILGKLEVRHRAEAAAYLAQRQVPSDHTSNT